MQLLTAKQIVASETTTQASIPEILAQSIPFQVKHIKARLR